MTWEWQNNREKPMTRFIVAIFALVGLCASSDGRGCRRNISASQHTGINISCMLEQDGRETRVTMPVRGGKILWVRFLEQDRDFRCEIVTDTTTHVLLFRCPCPEKIELKISYGPSVIQRKRTVTGIWCLAPKDIPPGGAEEFQREKGGIPIGGDAGRIEVVFEKGGGGVRIRSEMTSTYANTFTCGWWPGFVIQVLFREP